MSCHDYEGVMSFLCTGGLNYYVLTSKISTMNLLGFILYWKTLLLLLRWDMGKVRDRFCGMGRFKVGLMALKFCSKAMISQIII